MGIRHEIKSQLAKLLATEDLVVEHRQVETAQFDVHNRILTLPQWDRASEVVYDLLVGHEVGHALFTPDEDGPSGIPHQFINVTEDARIEKLMKRKYAGLYKTFRRGYSELSNEDFFCLENEDIGKMNLADRANLHFKIGEYTDIPFFSAEEDCIIKTISDAETFEDACEAAKMLHTYCKKKPDNEEQPELPQNQTSGSSVSSMEKQDQEEGKEETTTSESQEPTDSETASGEEEIDSQEVQKPTDEVEVKTADNLEDKLKELINDSSTANVYVERPILNLDTVIADNSEIHQLIDDDTKRQQQNFEADIHQRCDAEYVNFKRSAQKEVNYLVKEFECRKAADSYARASTSRTGVLDCTKLHTYKYNEDLFKKVTTLADGKNHGLVFVLDWSGSMSEVLLDTCKQMFNLIWFCKKVNIPFEVYAFSNEWIRRSYGQDLKLHYEEKEGLLTVDENFTLMNILTSKVNNKVLELQLKNIWRIASTFSRRCYYGNYDVPARMSLSGTPLNESIVALHQILPMFQRQNKIQKVHCIILTDGEAGHLNRHVKIVPANGDPYMGSNRLTLNSFLRDRKTGTTCKVPPEHYNFTNLMLKNLKDNFPSVSIIGIRLLAPRDGNNFIRMHGDNFNEREEMTRRWRKEKSFVIKSSGYDAYFAISSTAVSQDAEFDVDEGATKTKIKQAFIKSLRTKKMNKRVLGEFISLVA